jgi:hypothetical protein
MCADDPTCGCPEGKVGNPVVIWPGWGINPARWSGADEYPDPVPPKHYSNFTATQTQLLNGLQRSTFGRYDSYYDYLRAINSSAVNAGSKNQKQLPPYGIQPAAVVQPSGVQLQQMIAAGAPGAVPSGGVGTLAPGVNLSNRRFYG